MPLNPQVEALLGMFAQAPPVDWATVSASEMRAANDVPLIAGDPPPVAEVRELSIKLNSRTLEARLYIPEDAGADHGLLVFYHGGGWVIGTLDTHDGTCRALANRSGVAILSVAYRLAPEHPFPAPLDDCYDSLVWAFENASLLGIDGSRIAVGGDSAGGNLAGAVAIMARDRKGPKISHQLLIYPVTDMNYTRASFAENGGGEYFLTESGMRWFWECYIGSDAQDISPLAAILRTPDLAGLPTATVITAQYDPLRDEGKLYGDRLIQAGVPVKTAMVDGMIHGFFSMFAFAPDAWESIDMAGKALAEALARKGA